MKKNKSLFNLTLLSWEILLLFISVAHASEVKVTPIRIDVPTGEKISSFELKNTSDVPVTLKLQVQKWNCVGKRETLEDTKDVLVTPPLVTLSPQQTQIGRVGILTPPDPSVGGTYRLILTEIPQPFTPSKGEIRTLLKIMVPLLVDPSSPSKAQAVVHPSLSNKTIRIKAMNTGKHHFRINKIRVFQLGNPEAILDEYIFNYIIPSQEKEWEFSLPTLLKEEQVQVIIETDCGDVSTHPL